MAKRFPQLDDRLTAFLLAQPIFFTASAAAGTRVNVSPRDTASLRVLDPNTVAYVDRTGSGNETAAHLAADGRLTLMVCAFSGPPQILRLYGRGTVLPRSGGEFAALAGGAFGGEIPPGTRQMVRLDFDLVQTSCGFNVPLFEHVGPRDTLDRWAASKGEEGLSAYRREKNLVSMDGLPTFLED